MPTTQTLPLPISAVSLDASGADLAKLGRAANEARAVAAERITEAERAERELTQAEANDRKSAADAIDAGKAVPAPTLPKARDAAEAARRLADASLDVAWRRVREFRGAASARSEAGAARLTELEVQHSTAIALAHDLVDQLRTALSEIERTALRRETFKALGSAGERGTTVSRPRPLGLATWNMDRIPAPTLVELLVSTLPAQPPSDPRSDEDAA